MPPLPDTHRAEVFTFSLDVGADRLASLREILSADERTRAEAFVFPLHANRYIAGRGTLRQILAARLDAEPSALVFRTNAYGKPSLAAPGPQGLHFNLSHTGDVALLALSRTVELGVDVEEIRGTPVEDGLPAMVFSAREQAVLAALPPDRQLRGFYLGWTRKEAFVKACGRGLSMPLKDFDVTLDPDAVARVERIADEPGGAGRWALAHLDLAGGLVGAIAAQTGSRHIAIELVETAIPTTVNPTD